MHVYIAVTKDEYELPIALGDSARELAEQLGTTENAIRSSISHAKAGVMKWTMYRKVEIDDEE